MDDFLKNIKDEVNKNQKSFDTQGAWQKFTKFRSRKDKSNGIAVPGLFYLTAAAMLVLLLGSNFYWYQKNKPVGIMTELRTDTIYLTKYIERESQESKQELENYIININESKTSLQKAEARIYVLEQMFYQKSSYESKRNQSLSYTENEDENSFLASKKNKPSFSNENENSGDDLLSVSNVKGINEQISIPYAYTLSINPFIIKNKSFSPTPKYYIKNEPPSILEVLSPKSLSLYGSIGYITHIKGNQANFHGTSFSLGINSLFSDQIRFSGGVSFNTLFTEVYDIQSVDFIPKIEIPDNSFLNEVYINNYNLHVRAGFDYLFKNKSFWRFYTGLGYSKVITFQQNFTYKFNSDLTNYYVEGETDKINKYDNFLVLRFGVDFNFSKNIDGTLGVNFLHNLQNPAEISISINPGLYYHF